jgi:hypothetical protein
MKFSIASPVCDECDSGYIAITKPALFIEKQALTSRALKQRPESVVTAFHR